MNKKVLIPMFIFLAFLACKKDSNTEIENNESTAINESFFTPSSVSDADIVDFLDDLEEDTTNNDSADNFVPLELEEAMYYVSSAASVWLRDFDKTPYEFTQKTFTIGVDFTTNSDGDKIVSASDIIGAYSEIYNECVEIARDEVTFDETDLSKFILFVTCDVTGTVSGTTADVDVKFIVANDKSSGCTYDKDWYAYGNAGGCNSNSSTIGDATRILTRGLNSPCNRDWSCTGGVDEEVAFRIPHSTIDLNYASSPYPDMWQHCTLNECLEANDLDYYHNEITSAADSEKPLSSLDIANYLVYKDNFPGGCSPEFHRCGVIYAECFVVPIQATEYPPNLD